MLDYITKEDLIDYFKNDFTLYENEYDIILKLVNELDDRLFVKIAEEVVLGNMTWLDFKPIFTDSSYAEMQIASFDSQKDFSDRYNIFMQRINELKQINMISHDIDFNMLINTNNDVVNMEKRNIVYSMYLNESPEPAMRLFNTKFIRDLNDENNKDVTYSDILLSVDSYKVPVHYQNITLSAADLEYAKLNDLDLDSVRKAKSLALYYSNLWYAKNND